MIKIGVTDTAGTRSVEPADMLLEPSPG